MDNKKGVWGEQDDEDLLDPVGELQEEELEDIAEADRILGPLTDNEALKKGDIFRDYPSGPAYVVQMVNQSRARCLLIPEKGRILKAAVEINISPHSGVTRVSPQSLVNEVREVPMAEVAGIPVASKSTREREQARKGAKAEAKSAAVPRPLVGAAAASKARPKVVKAQKTVKPCVCGCGEETMSYFFAGHDARFKSWMVKIERGTMQVGELPKSVQKAFEFKKRGPGFVSTLNYKGEKHSGYDTKAKE